MPELYIGLMSGTSLDGIDAGLVDFSNNQCQVIDFDFQPFDQTLKLRLAEISQAENTVQLSQYGALDSELGLTFSKSIQALLKKANILPEVIKAVGSHGVTTHHSPNSPHPFSLQIGDPNIIAEITGITTIADFRRRDLAAGGQGAPLVPAFHQYFFANDNEAVCVVNIGGIANITLLDSDSVLGFDTGPGNTLMDYWINKNHGLAYDKNGNWAKTGKVSVSLLEQLKQDKYFSLRPPKSTGKEYFSPPWLERHLTEFASLSPEDIQRTLCQLTADSICDAIQKHSRNKPKVLLCGGGCHNSLLFKLIEEELKQPVFSTAEFGMHPDHVEAIAFAWLARQTINHLPGNMCTATGARQPVILGGIYPGGLVKQSGRKR